MKKILIKVTNGTKVHIENVSDLIDYNKNDNFYKPIKIKETDLELYKGHFIWEWSDKFYNSTTSLPDWIYNSQLLEFELLIE